MYAAPPSGHVAAPPRVRRSAVLGWALLLAFGAPLIAETVASSNTPAFLFPLVAPLFAVVYGVPALLVRELWVRGRLTGLRMLVVGVGYTAFNEGLIAATWFKLSPKDGKVLGFTAHQAWHAGGVNWTVAVNLTVYHTVYSLLVPILAVQAIARSRRSPLADRPWLGRRTTVLSLVVLALVVLGSLTPKAAHDACRGPAEHTCRIGREGAAGLIVVVAVLLAVLPVVVRAVPGPWRPRRLLLLGGGVLFGVAFFVSYFAFPLNGLPQVSVVTGAALAVTVVVGCRRVLAAPADPVPVALACLALLTVGMAATLLAWPAGQPVCAVLVAVLLVRVVRRGRGAGLA